MQSPIKYFVSSRLQSRLVITLACFLLLVALAIAFQHYYIIDVNTSPRYSLSWHIPFNIFYFMTWLVFLPLIKALSKWTLNVKPEYIKRFTDYFVIPTGLVIIHQLIAAIVINIVLDYMELTQLIIYRILRNPWIWLDFIVYFLILAIINLESYLTQSEQHELRFNQLQDQLTKTRLGALKSQLHPHFLFNTLNTLSTLILKKDNKEAERMLGLLEKYLSTTLNESDKSFVNLAEEMKYIRRYLEIEKVRFKDKLTVIEELDERTLDYNVPIFILQPIVENSIHHAIAVKKDDGIIKISSFIRDSRLTLIIEDNGTGSSIIDKKHKDGVGLKITKERLQQHYGSGMKYSISGSKLGGYQVSIELPIQTSEN